jgi:hypothetical protein
MLHTSNFTENAAAAAHLYNAMFRKCCGAASWGMLGVQQKSNQANRKAARRAE